MQVGVLIAALYTCPICFFRHSKMSVALKMSTWTMLAVLLKQTHELFVSCKYGGVELIQEKARRRLGSVDRFKKTFYNCFPFRASGHDSASGYSGEIGLGVSVDSNCMFIFPQFAIIACSSISGIKHAT